MADTEHFVDGIAGHVRGLLKDAEQRAFEILGKAEAEATALREQAEAEAARIRHQAEADAASIRGPAELTAERAESGAKRLLGEFRQALEQLEATLGWDEVADSPSQPVGVIETPNAVTERLAAEGAPAAAVEAAAATPEAQPAPEVERAMETTTRAAETATRGELSDDAEAARLVAMKLALEGSTPAETKATLAAEYQIEDLDSLIDQVYTQSAHLSRIRKWMPSLKRPE